MTVTKATLAHANREQAAELVNLRAAVDTLLKVVNDLENDSVGEWVELLDAVRKLRAARGTPFSATATPCDRCGRVPGNPVERYPNGEVILGAGCPKCGMLLKMGPATSASADPSTE